MRYSTLLSLLWSCLAPYSSFCLAQAANENSDPLYVFLQGSTATELRELVVAIGGTITHELHIIDAVGARLTASQLEQVIQSPLVARHFDDLSVSPPTDDDTRQDDDKCDVGGSLELAIGSSSLSWTLYNKKDKPAPLERLQMKWPKRLGAIASMSLGGKDIKLPATALRAAGSMELEFSNAPQDPVLTLTGTQQLLVEFEPPTGGGPALPPRQREFEIEAKFSPDCSTELIPGYDDNHNNFYYNGVAGVDALHLNGVTGRGITVAVIDSGLWEHPAIARDTNDKPRILARYNAITDTQGKEVFDESGHGTHMTSIIAHSGPVSVAGTATGTFKGVAPDANLVSVKAFDVQGQGDFLDIVRAVQWVINNREAYNIRVLNLSFAARPRWHYWLDPINQAVMQAWASGITVVAAAGNEGPEPMTIGSPGNLPFVITVGAVTDSWTPYTREDDYIPDFSSRGPTPNAHIKPDLVAPGGHITGVTRPGSGLTRKHPEYVLSTGEFVMTGSSQASALVAGIAALLLQLEPDLSPDDIKCKLMTSAEPAINRDGLLAYSPFTQGHGYANASRAVTLGQRGCGNAGMDIHTEMTGAGHSLGPAIVEEDGSVSLPGLSDMLSPEPAEKGLSQSRRWGVKAHMERDPPLETVPTPAPGSASPFDWLELYLQEKSAIENLSRNAPN